MSLSLPEQVLDLLTRAKRPVIVLPKGAGVDGYAAALALLRAMKRFEKPIDVVAADGPVPETLHFLKGEERVQGSFGALRKFVVSIDVKDAPLDELSYSVENDRLSIFLTPRSGLWTEKDVVMSSGDYRYDVIVILGAASLDAFGELFSKHTEFWYATPVVNIDHTPANEHYGQVNAVDLTATSVCEVLFGLFEKWDASLIDEEVATMLLAGQMAKTQSFKSAQVTPRTLQVAGTLLQKGARRQEIVDHLFRTRSVATLRLWGRALARLKVDREACVVWTMLTWNDFVQAGAGEEALLDVTDELIRNAPEAEVTVLLYENKERQVCGIISAGKHLDSVELALPFKPTGTRQSARICLPNATLAKAEEDIVRRVIERVHKLRAA